MKASRAAKQNAYLVIDERPVPFSGGETVLALTEANGIELPHSCGGMGTCGTCRILVESDLSALPERDEIEQEMAAERNFKPRERLACQLLAAPGLRIRIPIANKDESDLA